jgi:hypothetical protein
MSDRFPTTSPRCLAFLLLVLLAAPALAQTPTITGLSPSSRTAGAPAFTLTVSGSGFANGTSVQWNGASLTTMFLGATQLTAVVPAALIASPGMALVTVQTSGGVISNALPFTINPAPAITGLTPASRTASSPDFTLTVTGGYFPYGTVVLWNDSPLTTAFVSTTQLTAAVSAALTASPSTANVAVLTPDAVFSSAVPFAINPAPTVSSLAPTSRTATAPAFTLTVTGANLASGVSAQWNGAPLVTTFVTTTQLTAAVPAALIASPGTASVTVQTPDGVSSNALPFTVNPAPTISSLTPASRTASAPGFTLTVTGSGFANGMAVQWNGFPLITTFVSATQLTAAVPAALLASPGTASVTVQTPDGAASNALPFTVNPAPTIASLTPASCTASSPGFTLTVTGSGFANGISVEWNGSPLVTTFLTAEEVTAQVPAALVAAPGSAAVTVATADGVVSNAVTFQVAEAVPTVSAWGLLVWALLLVWLGALALRR